METAKKDDWQITGIEPNDMARKLANEKTDNAVYNADTLFVLLSPIQCVFTYE